MSQNISNFYGSGKESVDLFGEFAVAIAGLVKTSHFLESVLGAGSKNLSGFYRLDGCYISAGLQPPKVAFNLISSFNKPGGAAWSP